LDRRHHRFVSGKPHSDPASAGAARWQDLIAGLSLAGLLLPEAVAYSGIAALPPQAGIIAVFAGLSCYALIGSSRFAIVSATSSSAAVLAAATASLAGGDPALRLALAYALVLMAGALFVVAGVFRLGNVTDFISKPVLRGFAFGLAIVIIVKQIESIVAVHPGASELYRDVIALAAQVRHWRWTSVAVGLAALALLTLLAPLRRVPGGLIVIALGIAASHFLDLPGRGVSVVGTIHLSLEAPSLPELARAQWFRLGELGMALVMVLYAESYGSIRSFAIKHGDDVNANRDLVALGVANAAAGLFHGMPVGAGYSATSANDAAGAVSRWAGVAASLTLLALAVTVLPLIALTPQPVLAAIVVRAVSHSLHPSEFRQYFAWHRDRVVAVTAVIAVLWLGVLDGLLVAIAISLAMLLRRFSETSISALGRLGDSHDFVSIKLHPEARAVAGLIILRPEAPLFFANADRILVEARRQIAGAAGAQGVILSLEETFDLDSTSVEALTAFFAWTAARRQRLVLARLKPPVQNLLALVVKPGATAPVLSGLSVDDAVHLAVSPGA
jgi:MFS superfamily sulfate permease-like transporter